MRVFRDSADLRELLKSGCCLTVGTFDGVHLGHARLIMRVVEQAKNSGRASLAITFEPHPIYVLRPEIKVERIALPEEKIQRLSKFGLDYLLILDFNNKLANFRAMRFFEEILLGDLSARFIALGFNHTFGKDREGNLDFLKQAAPGRGVQVSAVEPCFFEAQPISSSRIRNCLKEGEIEKANRMLAEPFSIPGVIVKGKGLGHKLGFPTINIKVETGKLLPGPGVYAADCQFSGRDLKGMMYIHPKPEGCELEINLFDFDQNVYSERIIVWPRKFTRAAIRFPDYDSLARRLADDKNEIKRYFGIV